MNKQNDISSDTYDRGIVPAETAARKEREGAAFKHPPEPTEEEKKAGLDTTSGYTVDNEGLVNNFAIEPEMYVEVPGDLQQEEAELAAERAEELAEINETDETGKLTDQGDKRGKGTGII